MTGRIISGSEFAELLRSFDHTAFRLELQREYREPEEAETLARFQAGDPQDPTEVPMLRAWYDQVRALTSAGRRIERVRVHEDPPTDYQRWERWIGRWNIAAGETMRYLTRAQAHEIGLLPAAGNADWWLLDDQRLILMRFDQDGGRTDELTDDPELLEQARAWRDLAVRHSALEDTEDALTA